MAMENCKLCKIGRFDPRPYLVLELLLHIAQRYILATTIERRVSVRGEVAVVAERRQGWVTLRNLNCIVVRQSQRILSNWGRS